MMNDEQQLPDGWILETLGNVTKINGRDIAIRDLSDNLPVTFVPIAAVDAEEGIIARPEERPLKDVRKGFTPFSDGDVLLAKITPSMENGKAAIARNLKNGRGFGSTEFHVFRPKETVTAEWIFHFIRQESFRRDAKANFAGTAGQLRVPAGFLVDYPIPVPPLAEQEQIVAKIEELFTQLEAGTSALAKVHAGLRRYKASVLKAACEGKLVNRESGIGNESAKETLRHALEKRKTKRPLLTPPDNLLTLPEEWCWATTDQLADGSKYALKAGPFGSSLKKEYYVPKGYKIYGQEQVISGDPHYGDYYIDNDRYEQLKSNVVKSGDILISLVGTIGKVLILPENIEPGIINPRLVKLSLDSNLIDSQ